MKQLVIFISLFLFTSAFAQKNMQWRAVYQYKRILNEKQKAKNDSLIKARPEMAAIIKKLSKRFNNRTYFLDFTKAESVYKEKARLEKDGGSFMRDRILYKNLTQKTFTEKRPFLEKDFLVVDTLPDYHWKVTGETKNIGNYTVIKAVGTEKIKKSKTPKNAKDTKGEPKNVEKEVIAWFTPELPISNGPGKYWGLPGLIMEVDKDGAVILLKELIINPIKFNKIECPEKGQKVNEKEFREIMKKERLKMEKMFKNRRHKKGSDRVIIKM